MVGKALVIVCAVLALGACARLQNIARVDPPGVSSNRLQPAQNKAADPIVTATPNPTAAQAADDATPLPAPSSEVSARAPSPHRAR